MSLWWFQKLAVSCFCLFVVFYTSTEIGMFSIFTLYDFFCLFYFIQVFRVSCVCLHVYSLPLFVGKYFRIGAEKKKKTVKKSLFQLDKIKHK